MLDVLDPASRRGRLYRWARAPHPDKCKYYAYLDTVKCDGAIRLRAEWKPDLHIAIDGQDIKRVDGSWEVQWLGKLLRIWFPDQPRHLVRSEEDLYKYSMYKYSMYKYSMYKYSIERIALSDDIRRLFVTDPLVWEEHTLSRKRGRRLVRFKILSSDKLTLYQKWQLKLKPWRPGLYKSLVQLVNQERS